MAIHLQELLKDVQVGSIAATTPSSARRICRRVAYDRAKVVVEYGPGDGAITERLLRRMRPDAVLIAIERNGRFVDELKTKVRDPRLKVFHDSAENVSDILQFLHIKEADCVISGVPFSLLSLHAVRKILTNTKRILRPGGRFLVYQSLTAPIQRVRTKRLISHSFLIARERFLFLNMPPLYFLEAIPRTVLRTMPFAVRNYK